MVFVGGGGKTILVFVEQRNIWNEKKILLLNTGRSLKEEEQSSRLSIAE